MKWQPIETAPKDGTPILGARVCEYMDGSTYMDGAIVMYERDGIGHTGWAYMGFLVSMVGSDVAPTHWLPLPAPPEAAE